jgi:hypothetical protein
MDATAISNLVFANLSEAGNYDSSFFSGVAG